MEKPKPLYDDAGRVNDPKIARSMADHEEEVRELAKSPDVSYTGIQLKKAKSKEEKQKIIDSSANLTGDLLQERKEKVYVRDVIIPRITDLISGSISEDEKRMLKTYLKNQSAKVDSDLAEDLLEQLEK